jgi:hypothetical protein
MTMDMDALKANVKKALAHLPPDMQLDASRLFSMVEKHMPTIEKIGPLMMPLLGDDVMALAVEWQCKMLDKENLNKTLREAFAESGIVIPGDPNAVPAGPST